MCTYTNIGVEKLNPPVVLIKEGREERRMKGRKQGRFKEFGGPKQNGLGGPPHHHRPPTPVDHSKKTYASPSHPARPKPTGTTA